MEKGLEALITLKEACYIGAANGAVSVSDAVKYVLKHSDQLIPKENEREEIAMLIKCASRYPKNAKVADVIKAER